MFGTEAVEKSETQSRFGCCGKERNHYLCPKSTHTSFDGIKQKWANVPPLSYCLHILWRLSILDGSVKLLTIGWTIGARFPAAAKTYLFSNTSRPACLHLDPYPVGAENCFPGKKAAEAWFWSLNERIAVVNYAWSSTPTWCVEQRHIYLYSNELISHFYSEYNILVKSG
jgi:hypothetical protein